MNWADLITELEEIFRISDYDFEKFNISRITIYKLRTGVNKKAQKNTIKLIENALGIKIDARNQDNLSYEIINREIEGQNLPSKEVKNQENDTIISLSVFNKFPLIVMGLAGKSLNYIPQEAILDYVEFPYPNKQGCYAIKLNGDNSMGSVIKNGDVALIDPSQEVNNGNTVFCRLITGEYYIKLFRKITVNLIQLYCENSAYEPITVDMSQIETLHKIVISYHYH